MSHPIRLIASLLLVALLAACGSAPRRDNSVAPSNGSGAAPAVSAAGAAGVAGVAGRPAPALPKAGSGRGAYYKDDGPGDNPPAGLELTLDAEPRVEPYLTNSANKPYVVFGKTYTPVLDDQPFSQRGIGSWYGKKFHGQKTSSGELYDMYKMTAAHPTLPIPSYARITNLSNGKQVIVKINDRGPFHTSRIVDLSYTAALKLDYLSKGSSELLLERLLPADIEKMAENRRNSQATTQVASAAEPTVSPPAPVKPDTAGFEALVADQSNSAPQGSVITVLPVPAVPATTVTPLAVPANVPIVQPLQTGAAAPMQTDALVPAVTADPNPANGFYVQFGAFGLRSNAENTFLHLQSKLAQLPGFEIVQQGALYRLFSGPFASRDDANQVVQLALRAGLPKPVVVQR